MITKRFCSILLFAAGISAAPVLADPPGPPGGGNNGGPAPRMDRPNADAGGPLADVDGGPPSPPGPNAGQDDRPPPPFPPPFPPPPGRGFGPHSGQPDGPGPGQGPGSGPGARPRPDGRGQGGHPYSGMDGAMDGGGFELPMEKAPFLGVSLSPPDAVLRGQLKLPQGTALVVDYVSPQSPAEAAGIKQFDVLTKFNDQLLIDPHQLMVLVHLQKAGDDVSLTVIHEGATQTVTAKLDEKEQPVMEHPGQPDGMMGGMMRGMMGAGDMEEGMDGRMMFGENGNRVFIRRYSPGSGGASTAVDAKGIISKTLTDDKGSVTLTIDPKTGKHLLVKDASGKNTFDGPVDTAEQQKAIPADSAEKLRLLEQDSLEINLPPPAPPAAGGHPPHNPGEDPLGGRPN